MIKDIDQFDSLIKSGDQLVVLDCSASWCGPCRNISPVFDSLAAKPEYANVTFLKFDVEDVPALSSRYGVASLPTFLFFRKGEVVHRFSGASAAMLTESVNKYN